LFGSKNKRRQQKDGKTKIRVDSNRVTRERVFIANSARAQTLVKVERLFFVFPGKKSATRFARKKMVSDKHEVIIRVYHLDSFGFAIRYA